MADAPYTPVDLMERITEIGEQPDLRAHAKVSAYLVATFDVFVAEAIRSGQAGALQEMGFTATDEALRVLMAASQSRAEVRALLVKALDEL